MKMFVFVFALLGTTLAFAGRYDPAYWRMVRKGVEAKIVLTVVDDLGSPVRDAAVHAIFSRTNDLDPLDGKTDVHGKCEFQHLTNGNRLEFFISKDGYYGSQIRFTLIKMWSEHKIEKGCWQPCPIEKTVVLKKKRNPTSLTSGGGWYDLPGTNQWYSFDMMKNDWVKPFGNGEVADIELRYRWTGAEPLKWQEQFFDIRFLGVTFNGAYYAPATTESRFAYVYHACPGAQFVREFSDENHSTIRKFGMLDGNRDMVFRIRSETNSLGRLESCYYGRFRKLDYYLKRSGIGGASLRYEYNSVRNDTNLESKTYSGNVR